MLAIPYRKRAQVALAFPSAQQGIQSPGAQPVAMASQLFDNSQPENRLFRRMVKDVQSDQARIDHGGEGGAAIDPERCDRHGDGEFEIIRSGRV
jgi:hypothetical protein